MEDFKKIGDDVKKTIFDLYNKPSEGVKQDGIKGGIKGFGSAAGNFVEHCFTVPVDLSCSTYNLIKSKVSKNDDKQSKNKSDEESSEE
jgi:hypothetical protein